MPTMKPLLSWLYNHPGTMASLTAVALWWVVYGFEGGLGAAWVELEALWRGVGVVTPSFEGVLLRLLALALLYYALIVTSDYRKRRAFARSVGTLDTEALYAQFHHAMFTVAAYIQRRFAPQIPKRIAEDALVLATVLREVIEVRAGGTPPRSYLRSRRELWRIAAALPAPAQGTARP